MSLLTLWSAEGMLALCRAAAKGIIASVLQLAQHRDGCQLAAAASVPEGGLCLFLICLLGLVLFDSKVLYPITLADFIIADVTDSMLDGVIDGFPNTYASSSVFVRVEVIKVARRKRRDLQVS